MHVHDTQASAMPTRASGLAGQVREVFRDVAGFDLQPGDDDTGFLELGLDSLMLTQIAVQLQKTFGVVVSFRQLMTDCTTLATLTCMIAAQQPAPEPAPVPVPVATAPTPLPVAVARVPSLAPDRTRMPAAARLSAVPARAAAGEAGGSGVAGVLVQQMQLMSQQLQVLGRGDTALVRDVILRQQQVLECQLALLGDGCRDTVAGRTAQTPEPDAAVAIAARRAVSAGAPLDATMSGARMDASRPVVPGARLGRSPEGEPGWYLENPEAPGRFLKVAG